MCFLVIRRRDCCPVLSNKEMSLQIKSLDKQRYRYNIYSKVNLVNRNCLFVCIHLSM